MLAPFFHAWERRLASVTKDRVVRPFDWGLDWIAPNGHGQSQPEERVAAWVNEALRDSSAFFDLPATSVDVAIQDCLAWFRDRGAI